MSIQTDSACCAPGCALPMLNRLIESPEIRLSEIMSALSVALDITQGQPEGHCMRGALIGMRLAEQIHLSPADRSALFYALLLKDLGCSSNAAKISYLFSADDRAVKRSARLMDGSPKQCLKHCWTNAAPGGTWMEKVAVVTGLMGRGDKECRQLSEVRCERGAQITRKLQLPEATAQAILDLDEHWNGKGYPRRVAGQEISLLGRICCLAQTVEVFFSSFGLESALEMARQRRGQWFDPQLVDALMAFQGDAKFWSRLKSDNLLGELSAWEPADAVLLADDECLDRVAESFALVVDAKSPWTYQHSTRVAEIAVGVARQFGCPPELERDVRRAALLHDIGKLGVSNLILDKAEKLTTDEVAEIRKHPDYSQQILRQVSAFQSLADAASADHERLDGDGYHRRLQGSDFPWVGRVLAVADICEAMSARRPYREALPWSKIREIMSADAGRGVDADCLMALERWHDRDALESRVDAQLAEVDRMLSDA